MSCRSNNVVGLAIALVCVGALASAGPIAEVATSVVVDLNGEEHGARGSAEGGRDEGGNPYAQAEAEARAGDEDVGVEVDTRGEESARVHGSILPTSGAAPLSGEDLERFLLVGGSLSAAFGLSWWLLSGGLARLVPLVPGFTKVPLDRLLEQPKRRALFEAISADPGVHIAHVQKRLDLAHGQVRHHLRMLEKGGLVVARKMGGTTHLYPVGAVDRRLHPVVANMQNPARRRVADAVCQAPGINCTGLANEVGVSPGTISHHTRHLIACGALQRVRQGNVSSFCPPEELNALLAK